MHAKLALFVVVLIGHAISVHAQPIGFRKPTVYEQELIDLTMAKRNRSVELFPEGKTIRRITVKNFDVFLSDHWTSDVLNAVHVTSKPWAVRRELALEEGQKWTRTFAEEAERKVRNKLFTSVAIVVPATTSKPNIIDVFVLTRDTWSIRANSIWEVQQGQLSRLYLGISENNVLGLRKQARLILDMYLGEYGLGAGFYDSNVGGTNVQADGFGTIIFGRASDKLEGAASRLEIWRPFFSTRDPLSWRADFQFRTGFTRSFVGTELRTYDVPETPEVEQIPFEYKQRRILVDGDVSYAMGGTLKHEITGGYRFSTVRNEFPPNLTSVQEQAYRRDVLPRTERITGPKVGYELYRTTFHTYRNLDLFGMGESVYIGPRLGLNFVGSPQLLGSTNNVLLSEWEASWSWAWAGEGFAQLQHIGSARLSGQGLVDLRLFALAKLVTPPLGGALRITVHGTSEALIDNRNNTFLTVGGQTGLRGFPIGAFAGQRRFVVNAEVRTLPVQLINVSWGLLAFYDAGGAADRYGAVPYFHNAGVGIRFVIPQLGAQMLRVDWAFALNGNNTGWPGRVVGGIEQVF